jgi:hypothetical protein
MPVIRDVQLNLSLQDILRRQDIRDPSRISPRILTATQQLMGFADKLLEPAVIYQPHTLKEADGDRLVLGNGTVFSNPELVSLLSPAMEIIVAFCTIGPRLEEKVQTFFAQRESLQGFLLDGIGSAAVDNLGRLACERFADEVLARGLQTSSPLSPGMGTIPLQDQRLLFDLAPAKLNGLSLTAANMLAPRKSVSMIIGIGEKMPTWHTQEVCDSCKIKETCRHRRCT